MASFWIARLRCLPIRPTTGTFGPMSIACCRQIIGRWCSITARVRMRSTRASWMDVWPREKFSHILYNDPDWRASLTLARSRPVGFFFSTDDVLDNPWDTLSTEWPAQQAALGARIGAPGAAASLTAGVVVGTSVSPGVGATAPQGVVASGVTAPSVAVSLTSGAAVGVGV